jgi:non-specific protein-tyrosine kinase
MFDNGPLQTSSQRAQGRTVGAANPEYSQTRMEASSPAVLKRNKILAFSHQGDVSHSMKILRTQILKKMSDVGGNSLLITSPNPREGKTFMAINLAVSLSHEINRTAMLVDTDLRDPEVHNYLGVSGEQGLSDYLLGQAQIPDVLVNPGIPKMTVLPGGRALPNSSELLGSPQMALLINELKGRYQDRFLIFDSTSLLTRADALVFSEFIDGILIVVEAEKTSDKDLNHTLKLLSDAPLMGIVYNKAK